jgi:2-amino-4-hydroxy-6-hydroxymethyldihydropteridine diphosphokinase
MPDTDEMAAQPRGQVAVLLSLGSNVEPQRYLRAALDELDAAFGGIDVSPAYRTAAVGFDGAPFVNAAAVIRTAMGLPALEDWLHALEDRHGRDRSGPRLSDRTLDVDVVFYGDAVVREGERLRVPRPELEHAFVLKPLADIEPHFVDPVSGCTLAELWRAHPQHGDPFEIVPL